MRRVLLEVVERGGFGQRAPEGRARGLAMHHTFGSYCAHVVEVSVSPGSNGQSNGNGAVDTIEGVGWIDGREVPLTCSIQATVSFPDVGGYGARLRQYMLAQSFAQWLPRQIGHF